MLLPGALFVLFLAGCWLYCLTDAALTPAGEYRGLSKAAWISIITATFIAGAIAWLIARRGWRASSLTANEEAILHTSHGESDLNWYGTWTAADDAIARHPAGRARQPAPDGGTTLKGPDDDLEFLRELDQRIRGTNADTGE